ncbi:YtxH domain-containing protein [Photobacterium sp. WH77]|uniref:YtxH domain-containing protein n=1 Tax=Photobacterium arenosum TaxID=2774143 RepID=A0ABR9BRN7_9GAMM|nr:MULTISPECIES: YtxH domain-containing protein [Photobacterium]MBD8514161.1 YtxH domain-containing protein [Photobacterium arenosum]MBV7262861.1 YtxH domain-containing protein [Photobacterium sp. WH24]MCG2837717.1 YtxH domain-containing protein [Photobacterium sp. WH77]MCG2845333.1 YtxH domain-containing protein [Photobacterium sp. WH80]MDO6581363.1 YtxH domain-containing protein [Photobacterium sp. 2_MG-2023]
MLKYIVIALVGLGIYIGVTYKDQIEDAMNARPMEEAQDLFEDMGDQAAEAKDALDKQLETLQN